MSKPCFDKTAHLKSGIHRLQRSAATRRKKGESVSRSGVSQRATYIFLQKPRQTTQLQKRHLFCRREGSAWKMPEKCPSVTIAPQKTRQLMEHGSFEKEVVYVDRGPWDRWTWKCILSFPDANSENVYYRSVICFEDKRQVHEKCLKNVLPLQSRPRKRDSSRSTGALKKK